MSWHSTISATESISFRLQDQVLRACLFHLDMTTATRGYLLVPTKTTASPIEPIRSMLGMRLSLLGPVNSLELLSSYPGGIDRLFRPDPANGTILIRLPL